MNLAQHLAALGVATLPPQTSGIDPGYSPVDLESHLQQSGHLLSTLKISMACWLIADEASTRRKTELARKHDVTTVTGGGPFEVSVAQGQFAEYLDLCADIGVDRIEAAEGFTEMQLEPAVVVGEAAARSLEVQFELGRKHDGTFSASVVDGLIEQGLRWRDAGAVQLVIEARESASEIGLFDADQQLNTVLADRFVEAFGTDVVVFEAPSKVSQFALLDHFGPYVNLANVRLEEILRVEIYRRGLHSDAFRMPNLRPVRPEQR